MHRVRIVGRQALHVYLAGTSNVEHDLFSSAFDRGDGDGGGGGNGGGTDSNGNDTNAFSSTIHFPCVRFRAH